MSLVRTSLRLGAGLFFLWALLAGLRVDTLRIRSPRLGSPFVGAGEESFKTVVDARGWVSADGWEWTLLGDGSERIALESSKGEGYLFRRSFHLVVPANTPNGKYTLETKGGDRVLRSSSAVFVVDPWPENWTVVHANDLPRLGVEDKDARFHHFLEVVRDLDPDAMLLTGDILYLGGDDRYRRLVAGLSSLPFPVIVAPGNHEREDWSSFIRYFPDMVHAIDLGPFRVLSLDSGRERDQLTVTQLDWFEEELAKAGNRPLLVQIHHPVFGWPSLLRGRSRLLNLLRRDGIAAVVSGHTHWDDFFGPDGERFEGGELPPQPWFITTTTAGIKTKVSPITGDEIAGVRVLELRGDKLVQAGFRATPDSVPTCIPMNYPPDLLPQ